MTTTESGAGSEHGRAVGGGPVGWLHTYKKTGASSLATYPIDMNLAFNRERWECVALYTAPASVPLEFDRTRDTSRRQTAVELLLSMGYVWATDHWEARKQPDALAGRQPVGVEPLGYIDEKDCVFDGGFKFTTPMVWGDPAANRIAVYALHPRACCCADPGACLRCCGR